MYFNYKYLREIYNSFVKKTGHTAGIMAGVERIELPSAVLETDVLPLYDTPINKNMTRTGFEPVNAAVKGRCVDRFTNAPYQPMYNNMSFRTWQ